jgi:two-component system, chemotaxis family, protein-glutamate methylesterase/glutaminase
MSRPLSSSTLPSGFERPARLVAVGASAGGVEALLELLPALPADFGVPVVVVLHLPEDRDSVLCELFAKRCARPVREAGDKTPATPGTIFFAPAGYHLLVEADLTFSLSCDAPECYSRPSIDVLFSSAADALGTGLVAVLLTGANNDGAKGLAEVATQGGLTVVQDPSQARSATMPSAAIALGPPDFILPLSGIRQLLCHLRPAP